jgi:hypothetical protein
VPTCGTGFAACGSACKDTQNDPLNCGACAKVCGPAGATVAGYDNGAAACVSSACAAHCSGSYADCDGNLDDGCEADRAHDAANCGACGTACSGATPYCTNGCVGLAAAAGVQENLPISLIAADWGQPCFSESYGHVGTSLTAAQTACGGTQVMVACAANGALTLTVAAFGPRATVFGGGTVAGSATFYGPGASTPAFGFTPPGAATSFSTFDTAGSSADTFTAGFGSQRLSWPVSGGALDAGGRCGDRIGTAATSGDLRLFFSK